MQHGEEARILAVLCRVLRASRNAADEIGTLTADHECIRRWDPPRDVRKLCPRLTPQDGTYLAPQAALLAAAAVHAGTADEPSADGTGGEPPCLLEVPRLAHRQIGALNVRAQVAVRCSRGECRPMRNLSVRQPRLCERTPIGSRRLRRSIVCCLHDGAHRACKGNFRHHTPACVVVDALDDLGRTHAHLVLPDRIGRIEK